MSLFVQVVQNQWQVVEGSHLVQDMGLQLLVVRCYSKLSIAVLLEPVGSSIYVLAMALLIALEKFMFRPGHQHAVKAVM